MVLLQKLKVATNKENEAQLLRIDKKILEDIKVHLVSDYKEVFEILKNI